MVAVKKGAELFTVSIAPGNCFFISRELLEKYLISARFSFSEYFCISHSEGLQSCGEAVQKVTPLKRQLFAFTNKGKKTLQWNAHK